MFKFMGKEINATLGAQIILIWTYGMYLSMSDSMINSKAPFMNAADNKFYEISLDFLSFSVLNYVEFFPKFEPHPLFLAQLSMIAQSELLQSVSVSQSVLYCVLSIMLCQQFALNDNFNYTTWPTLTKLHRN